MIKVAFILVFKEGGDGFVPSSFELIYKYGHLYLYEELVLLAV